MTARLPGRLLAHLRHRDGHGLVRTEGLPIPASNIQSLPLGHVGETEEIAHAYLYCVTQTFATGSVLTVDGGTVLV